MPFSRRTRFEILERDGHTCQSCGRTPPEVKLTADHVVPVSLGGTDDPSNGQALCFECNAGKSSRQPDAVTVAAVDADAARWADAMKRAAEQQADDAEANRELVSWFGRSWDTYSQEYDRVPEMERGWGQSILTMTRRGADRVMLDDALERAMRKKMDDAGRWRYFCKTVWNQLNERVAIAKGLLADAPDAAVEAPATPSATEELGRIAVAEPEDTWGETARWFSKVQAELLDRAYDFYAESITYWVNDHGGGHLEIHQKAAKCVTIPMFVGGLLSDSFFAIDDEEAFGSVIRDPEPSGHELVEFCIRCCPVEAQGFNAGRDRGDA